MLTRARRAALGAWRYVRYDLPEVFAPSSMPDPPHVAAQLAAERLRPRRSLREHARVRARWPHTRVSPRCTH